MNARGSLNRPRHRVKATTHMSGSMLEWNGGQIAITNNAVDELNVRARNSLAIGFVISLASNFAANAMEPVKPAGARHRHHDVRRHIPAARGAARVVAPPVSAVARPSPSLPVQNNSDGLSRDPEDCNTGCLDSPQ